MSTFILYRGQKKKKKDLEVEILVINMKIVIEMQQGALPVLCSEGML